MHKQAAVVESVGSKTQHLWTWEGEVVEEGKWRIGGKGMGVNFIKNTLYACMKFFNIKKYVINWEKQRDILKNFTPNSPFLTVEIRKKN